VQVLDGFVSELVEPPCRHILFNLTIPDGGRAVNQNSACALFYGAPAARRTRGLPAAARLGTPGPSG
jgi:hypothetical protein